MEKLCVYKKKSLVWLSPGLMFSSRYADVENRFHRRFVLALSFNVYSRLQLCLIDDKNPKSLILWPIRKLFCDIFDKNYHFIQHLNYYEFTFVLYPYFRINVNQFFWLHNSKSILKCQSTSIFESSYWHSECIVLDWERWREGINKKSRILMIQRTALNLEWFPNPSQKTIIK